MKNLPDILLVLLLGMAGVGHAMDGVFDRSAEVDKYIAALKTGTPASLVYVAKDISTSGIADPQLAAAVSERLLADYQHVSNNRADTGYVIWMTRALASFGIVDYAATIKIVAAGTSNKKIQAECNAVLPTIGWHLGKNTVMASKRYYSEGDDPVASRLMNLLMADDYSYKRYATERMNWDKVLDPRLMAAIAPQVQAYLDRGDKKLTDEQEQTMAAFVKLLGYSRDARYQPLLENAASAKNSSPGVRKNAKKMLDNLY